MGAPFSVDITVSAADLLVDGRITTTAWPRKVLRAPDEDGQFEVLVRRSAVPDIDARACRSSWLLVRMPAIAPPLDSGYQPKPRGPANQRRLDNAIAEYAKLKADTASGQPSTLRVNGGGDASTTVHGLKLPGCNLFFSSP
ncbi:hypothetical protein [Lichenicola sp.]|uniref:hypothetical protein n=1 Tax=Lichenicola sp. TaxID=2804529 RepID=UPI003B0004C0